MSNTSKEVAILGAAEVAITNKDYPALAVAAEEMQTLVGDIRNDFLVAPLVVVADHLAEQSEFACAAIEAAARAARVAPSDSPLEGLAGDIITERLDARAATDLKAAIEAARKVVLEVPTGGRAWQKILRRALKYLDALAPTDTYAAIVTAYAIADRCPDHDPLYREATLRICAYLDARAATDVDAAIDAARTVECNVRYGSELQREMQARTLRYVDAAATADVSAAIKAQARGHYAPFGSLSEREVVKIIMSHLTALAARDESATIKALLVAVEHAPANTLLCRLATRIMIEHAPEAVVDSEYCHPEGVKIIVSDEVALARGNVSAAIEKVWPTAALRRAARRPRREPDDRSTETPESGGAARQAAQSFVDKFRLG